MKKIHFKSNNNSFYDIDFYIDETRLFSCSYNSKGTLLREDTKLKGNIFLFTLLSSFYFVYNTQTKKE